MATEETEIERLRGSYTEMRNTLGACLEFMSVEMGWEFFREEYGLGDVSLSAQNARKLREYLRTHLLPPPLE